MRSVVFDELLPDVSERLYRRINNDQRDAH